MRRLEADRHGEPADVMRLVDGPDDPLGDHDVRLEVAAVGLNYLDLMRCRGTYPLPPAFPITFGVEVAGRVIAAGALAGGLVGADVLACPTLPRGALAERVVVDARLVVPRPPDVDSLVAAALPVNYQTAWFGLERGRVGPRSTVLVTAGAGGVGIAAIQLAVARGARVIAAAGGSQKTAVCLEHGAAVAVDYVRDDLPAAVLDATDGAGVDVVLDQVGGDGFAGLLDVVGFEGVVVAIGTAGGPIAPLDPMALAARNVGVIGLSWGSMYPTRRSDAVAACYERLFDLHRTGRVQPVLAAVIALDEVPSALGALGDRRTIGKVVVDLGLAGRP